MSGLIQRHPSDRWVALPLPKPTFEAWLDAHHRGPGRIAGQVHNEEREITSISIPRHLKVAMCCGWVYSGMHKYGDDHSPAPRTERRA
jgi:hypothetical protein